MTTTIQADGPPVVGVVWTPAGLSDTFTVLHVLVVAVFVLSSLLVMAVTGKLGFDQVRGTRLCHAEGSGEETAAAFGMVIVLVTGASTAAWSVGPDVGLLTLLVLGGLVVAAGWFIGRCESRRRAAVLYAAARRAGAGEQS